VCTQIRFSNVIGETRVVFRSVHLQGISLLSIMASLKLALMGVVSKSTLKNRVIPPYIDHFIHDFFRIVSNGVIRVEHIR
jgi:hypothetical protein